ncbi:SDR family NAD(P)-dependent oxidoreductase [Nesterenkonia cremea]|uniref:Short-chain dehydrogenase n=1 Tax=Nesterenkonia cremea TaxID=1882340 RepID=A0A917ES96_9MICC|nr:SDR family NAD(P)-dependent oxidoreductase [Nesterenkonia cremea]GGE73169.1 hypothetical protein GCM10011401_20320 [Nesterenkonia cremea]
MGTHTAVVTGSTAGLGAAFARQLAGQGYDLILVARDADRLRTQADALSSKYGIATTVLVADLVTDDGVGAVQERLSDMRNPVHLLVNNAGHGLASEFLESDLDAERDLLRLHVQTTMELTHTAARAMVRRRAGRIINVASVAGFTPTGTYSAAKSWVINFSKALHQQLAGDGVTVTALCPGLVRTEFHKRSGISIKGAAKRMWLDADDVVRQGLAVNAQGSAVCVPSRSYQVLTAATRFMPDSVVHWAVNRRMGMPGQQEGAEQIEAPDYAGTAPAPTPAPAAEHDADGTAEPTTDAIKTVDAYKASKVKFPKPPAPPARQQPAAPAEDAAAPAAEPAQAPAPAEDAATSPAESAPAEPPAPAPEAAPDSAAEPAEAAPASEEQGSADQASSEQPGTEQSSSEESTADQPAEEAAEEGEEPASSSEGDAAAEEGSSEQDSSESSEEEFAAASSPSSAQSSWQAKKNPLKKK